MRSVVRPFCAGWSGCRRPVEAAGELRGAPDHPANSGRGTLRRGLSVVWGGPGRGHAPGIEVGPGAGKRTPERRAHHSPRTEPDRGRCWPADRDARGGAEAAGAKGQLKGTGTELKKDAPGS